MKQLFFKSNILHIRTNEGEFVVINPEIIGDPETIKILFNDGKPFGGMPIEPVWPGGIELIETCKWRGNRDACANEVCWDLQKCQGNPTIKLARLLPKEKKDDIQPKRWEESTSIPSKSDYKEEFKPVSDNKPDFESQSETLYPLENARKVLCHDNPGQYIRREAYVKGCEHVWNTHVVPLQEENQRLKNDLIDALDLKEGNGPTALSMAISENKRLSAILSISDDLANGRDEVIVSSGLRIIKLESEIKALRDSLSSSERFRAEDAASHINEANALREEIERLKAEVLKEKFPEN